jgi:hypothetical protein
MPIDFQELISGMKEKFKSDKIKNNAFILTDGTIIDGDMTHREIILESLPSFFKAYIYDDADTMAGKIERALIKTGVIRINVAFQNGVQYSKYPTNKQLETLEYFVYDFVKKNKDKEIIIENDVEFKHLAPPIDWEDFLKAIFKDKR